MFYKSTLTTLAMAGVIGSVLGGQSAAARDVPTAPTTVSVRIAYGDLDLATQAGAKAMLKRIRFAAQDACGPRPEGVFVYSNQYADCVKAAVDRAVATLNSPVVSTLNGGNDRQVALASARP